MILSYQKGRSWYVIKSHYKNSFNFSLSRMMIFPRFNSTTCASARYFSTLVTTSRALPMYFAISSWVRFNVSSWVWDASSHKNCATLLVDLLKQNLLHRPHDLGKLVCGSFIQIQFDIGIVLHNIVEAKQWQD